MTVLIPTIVFAIESAIDDFWLPLLTSCTATGLVGSLP